MAIIRLLDSFGGYVKGEDVEMSDTRARWFIAHRLAERVKEGSDAETTASEKREMADKELDSDAGATPDNEEAESQDDDSAQVVVDDDDAVTEAPMQRPALSAPVGEWANYALARGASREDIKGLTKRSLIEQFGSD